MIDPVQAVIGIVVLLIAVGGLLYLFYARTNDSSENRLWRSHHAVNRCSHHTNLMDYGINAQAMAKVQQHTTDVQRGAALYAQYCFSVPWPQWTGSNSPKLNGNPVVNSLSDDDIIRIISAGVPTTADPSQFLMPAWSEQYGGPLTQTDIQYLFALIRSADPNYLSKNGYPTGSGSNGFSQVPSDLQTQIRLPTKPL